MKKYFYLPLVLGLIIACQEQAKHARQPLQEDLAQDTVKPRNPSELLSGESERKNHTVYLDSIVDGYVLMPFTYRVWEGDAVSKIIDKTWLELHRKNGSYYVGPASYQIENADEEPCSGLPTETIVPEEDVLLFFNISTIQKGAVDSVAFTETIIQPGKTFEFTFQNHSYKISATGIRFHKDEERNNPNANYTLKLYKDGKYLRTIVNQTSYNDTATELKFIGDLDKDGQPDFIFSSPRDYEEIRMIIILSGSQNAYDGNVQFDC